jgi:hypothetical protein
MKVLLVGGFMSILFVSSIVSAQTFTVIHSFAGSPDGSGPAAGLPRGPKGTFLGTPENGVSFGQGTVFKLNREGEVHVLYSFCPVTNCVGDDSAPFGSVILGNSADDSEDDSGDDTGDIHGTTFSAEVGVKALDNVSGQLWQSIRGSCLTYCH